MNAGTFLSSNAQDFIEDSTSAIQRSKFLREFLSSNAQDFIEERCSQEQGRTRCYS